jgi:hypothetical protein
MFPTGMKCLLLICIQQNIQLLSVQCVVSAASASR